MLPLSHLGFGSQIATELARPFGLKLPLPWLLAGCIGPDIIDKTVYYASVLFTGKHGLELGILSGTRLFGHTALLTLFLVYFAVHRRSPAWAALAIGTATHLLLDSLGDRLAASTGPHLCGPQCDGSLALLWPFKGWQFPVAPYGSLNEAKELWLQPIPLVAEALGAVFLIIKLKRRTRYR